MAAMFTLPASLPAFTDADGAVVPGSISEMRTIHLNGVDQWLVIRGRDASNPVLLFLHGGPGTPETPFLLKHNQGLFDDFVVVSWEQRGAGKSFSPRPPAGSMTLEQLILDTQALARYLRERFDQDRIYLVGHSWGTLLGMAVIDRHPEEFHALVSVSQTAHALREQKVTFDWITARAHDANDAKALRQLAPIADKIDEPLTLGDMATLLSWVDHYGGATFHGRKSFRELFWTVATTPVYTLREKIAYLRGERFSLAHLYSEVAAVDLFSTIDEVHVPVVFVHGRHDYQVPMEVAYDYYQHLNAPLKRFVVFENAAHGVLYEDPDRFRQVMAEVTVLGARKAPRGEDVQTAYAEVSVP